ncbi:MAG: polysaccharide deacetylase family protein [Bryobacterales bacterium]|nr:polysaccharide deacetylase family protein [Bryobacterales bacterium]
MEFTARIGKREGLARSIARSGALGLIERLPASRTLLALNYHRIGDPLSTPYDPTVYSATANELRLQMEYVSRHCTVISVSEVLRWLEEGNPPAKRACYALITFDDAYLDNYEIAFPILKSIGIPAVFFVPTAFIGTGRVPWWDAIAFLLKNSRRRIFPLAYPTMIKIDLESNPLLLELSRLLAMYKQPSMTDGERFLSELAEACEASLPGVSAERSFCNWLELRQMLDAGMAVEAHTHTHPILSQLPEDQQQIELATCSNLIKERLGLAPRTLAYPVGMHSSFTEATKHAATRAGFKAAFSFYGGMNSFPLRDPLDLRREAVGYQSIERFRSQVATGRAWGGIWP